MSQALQGFPIVISEERPRKWRYSYSAGPIRSKFLMTLRDQRKILGTKCPSCGRVYVPARSTCLECFENMHEWVEVKDEGLVETFTVVYKSSPNYSSETPIAFAVVKLEGADTGIVHKIGEVDFDSINVGMRVKAVFGDRLKGDITDIKYFKPV